MIDSFIRYSYFSAHYENTDHVYFLLSAYFFLHKIYTKRR